MMKIGNIELKNNIILAPMAGVADLPMRIVCHSFGAGLSYTEMVSAKALTFENEKTYKLMNTENLPTAVQLFGSEPDAVAKAVPEAEKAGLFLDLNMGCPAPKITGNGEGSALMKDLGRAKAVIEAAVGSASKPVTVKMRAGWDSEHINAPALARIAENAGAAAVTVHGRTREQFYSGQSDRSVIKLVREEISIPLIANGDVFSPEDALSLLAETEADGVMIGRGSRGNPWIFARTLALLGGGEPLPEPTKEERIRVASEHIALIVKLKGEYIGIREARKHAAWYIHSLHGAAALRREIHCAETLEKMTEILKKAID